MGQGNAAGDIFMKRLETELREKTDYYNATLERCNGRGGDLTEEDQKLISDLGGRMGELKAQIENVSATAKVAYETRSLQQDVSAEIDSLRGKPQLGEVEYSGPGEYIIDVRNAAIGDDRAKERLELFYRAAAHQKTSDNLGVIPNPVVGEVINFVDGQRPLVQALGPRPMPGARWSRPRVTQHTAVGLQGTAGAAADEKSELVSQKMVIGELTGTAKTYGGYVNVSRQNIDFADPSAFDIIVNDLALQYALETENATTDALEAVATASVTYDMTPSTGTIPEAIAGAIWTAAGTVYSVVKGAGRLVLVFAPDRLAAFGPLFAPINPTNSQGSMGSAANFGQGTVGTIAGVTGVMSAGLGTGKAYLLSTAALEVYEQRIGQLQVVEPSVLGVQIAYAGYFTPMLIDAAAIVPLVAG